MRRPSNLSAEAIEDLGHILRGSARWGPAAARSMRARLVRQAERIGAGLSLGHKRADIPSSMPLLCIVEHPFVIIYDADTRIVLRIVDGRRDFSALRLPS